MDACLGVLNSRILLITHMTYSHHHSVIHAMKHMYMYMYSSVPIPLVPVLAQTKFKTEDELLALLDSTSEFRSGGTVEGVYLRIDGDDGFLVERAKVVRADFQQGITKHWATCVPVKNSRSF
jgi:hypothetical protein